MMARLRQMERAAADRMGMRSGWAIERIEKSRSKRVYEMELKKGI